MNRDGKNFLQMATVSALIITLFYMIGGGDPPEIQSAAGSGMEGVEKAIDSVGDTSSEYVTPTDDEIHGLLENQSYQDLLKSHNFHKLRDAPAFSTMCQDERFWKYMNGLKSSERYQPSTEFKSDPDFVRVTSSTYFEALQADPNFLSLMTEPTFIALMKSDGDRLEKLLAAQ